MHKSVVSSGAVGSGLLFDRLKSDDWDHFNFALQKDWLRIRALDWKLRLIERASQLDNAKRLLGLSDQHASSRRWTDKEISRKREERERIKYRCCRCLVT